MIFITKSGKEIQVPSDYTYMSIERFANEVYQQGRADMLMPYDVESIEELIANVRQNARADAIDEVYVMALNEGYDTLIEWLQNELED